MKYRHATPRHRPRGVLQTLCLCLWMTAPLAAENSAPTAGGPLVIRLGETGVVINYSGTLQQADTVFGPWEDIAHDTSPYEAASVNVQSYYRMVDKGAIFSSDAIVSLTLKGPFQQHFDLAFAGIPDGIFPPTRNKPYFDAQLEINTLTLPVRIRVRGNSSLQECPFPKLKVKIARSDREATPFENAREWKIGTHCAEGGHGNIGRLRDERAAFREALVYEVMTELGFISPRVRRARIRYHDNTPDTDDNRFGWQLTRSAFIFDHVEVVAESLGGRALEDEEIAALVNANFDPQLISDLRLFHALIGNWDYALSIDGQGLWNTEVIRLSDGSLLPVAGDFDLCSWVTGSVRVTAPRDYLPTQPDLVRQMRFELERVRGLGDSSLFQRGRDRFLQAEPAINKQVCASDIDDEGREKIMDSLTVFFTTLREITRKPHDRSQREDRDQHPLPIERPEQLTRN